MASIERTESTEDIAVKKIQTLAKGFGGDVKTVDDLSSPERYLYWQFPDWKSSNKTIMVPPAFTPSQLGLTVSRDGRYLHEDDVNIRGIIGEELVYTRLQQIGNANDLGMFVIYDFCLQDITKWRKMCKKEGNLPAVPVPTGQSDFLIFHHKKGVILMEVKNLKQEDLDGSLNYQESIKPPVDSVQKKQLGEKGSSKGKESECQTSSINTGSQSTQTPGETKQQTLTTEKISSNVNQKITDAKKQLNNDREIIRAFSKLDSDSAEVGALPPFPVIMVIALPSTKKGTVHIDPKDTLFIYEEDLESPDTLWRWWKQNIEEEPSIALTLAYELALSRTLAVRHLGPVSEPEYTAYTSYTLETFQHLEKLARKAFRTVKEKEYNHLSHWCQEMFQVAEFVDDLPTKKALKDGLHTALKSLNIPNDEKSLLKNLNDSLRSKRSRFFGGDHEPAVEDIKVFQWLSQEYVMDLSSIVHYLNRVAEASQAPFISVANRTLVDLNLDNTDKASSLNKLSGLLIRNKSKFLVGDSCTSLDVELCNQIKMGDIRVLPFPGKRSFPPIFTAEQLAVFEGPKKQLIIGGPGSGKTELMRCMALMLSKQLERGKEILYLIQLPRKEKSVFPNNMKQYFLDNMAESVKVKTIELEGEHYDVFNEQCSRIKLQKYSHVFIDELWIGSKIRYQMHDGSETIDEIDELKLLKDAIEKTDGYVWMSSVFDYREDCFDEVKSEEEIHQLLKKQRRQGKERPLYKKLGTPSLLETLKRNGGVISRIKHLLRSTNNIVKLLQDYSACYFDRDFPYGTDKMLNHNVEGQEIKWVVVQQQNSLAIPETNFNPVSQNSLMKVKELTRLMYQTCGDIIKEATRPTAELRPPSLMKTSKSGMRFQLLAGDILVVNFVARYKTENNLADELDRRGIHVFELSELSEQGLVPGDFSKVCQDKVCLLNSMSRHDSTLIEGTEWPMVIILLTSELLFTTAEKVTFEMLRNYDAYIAMFRAQAKLVVISNSWKNQQDFLKVVGEKIK